MKNTKLPSLIVIMILTTITTVFWISFGIYQVFTKEITSEVPEEIVKPLNPELDTAIINEIKNRINP